MEQLLLDALKSLTPTNILLVGVVVFLWRELVKEREARISALSTAMDLGHMVRQALVQLTDALNRRT